MPPANAFLMRVNICGEILMPAPWAVESGRDDWHGVAKAFSWPGMADQIDWAETACWSLGLGDYIKQVPKFSANYCPRGSSIRTQKIFRARTWKEANKITQQWDMPDLILICLEPEKLGQEA